MQFTPIDLPTWRRGQIFDYFARVAPTSYSLTVTVDVTALRRTLRQNGLKFFPAYLWLVTKQLNRQIEFKVAEKDGVLGYYDTLTPLYAHFHPDDETFSLMWTAYDDDFRRFHQAYLENQRRFGDTHGILSQPQCPPANAYTVSCLPWVSFQHFSVQSASRQPYYFPSVEAGKFTESGGRTLMPLSITCHHATTDGVHVAHFLQDLQQEMNTFARFL